MELPNGLFWTHSTHRSHQTAPVNHLTTENWSQKYGVWYWSSLCRGGGTRHNFERGLKGNRMCAGCAKVAMKRKIALPNDLYVADLVYRAVFIN